jgi:long-chain acyl-CoA synthetase
MNIAQILTGAAAHYPSKPLLRFRGEDVHYGNLVTQTDALTGALLARGIGPDYRVLILARNSPQWLVTLFAALRTGALVVPVNPALTASEVGYILGHAKPSLVVLDADLRNVLPPGSRDFERLEIGENKSGSWFEALAAATPSQLTAERDAEDPALMFYTSGTTGRPKGAVLSHRAEQFTAELVAHHYRLGPGDISMIASPLSFIYPLVIDCLASILAGATVVLQERFHPEIALRGIEAERATIFMGVPTMYSMMLDWAEGKQVDVLSLRFGVSAGQNLPWDIVQRFRKRFGVPVYDLWGQTEGTPITGYQPDIEPEGRPESCGRVLPGCAVRVVDDNGRDLPPGEVGEVLLGTAGRLADDRGTGGEDDREQRDREDRHRRNR